MVDISFNLWTCPAINWLRRLLFPVIVFDGNILRWSLIERLWYLFITQRMWVCHLFPSCVISFTWFKFCFKISSQVSDILGIWSVFMRASIWSKPYLQQYYLMSDHRSYLRIWRSCSLRSAQYWPHQHHLHSQSSRYYRWPSIIIANILCTTKSLKHLCRIKLPSQYSSRDIPSHFSQCWAVRWQAYCSPDNCPTSSASEDNWQLSDNTMKEVGATPCQPLQRSTAPSNSMPYHIAIGEVRIKRQENHLGWM